MKKTVRPREPHEAIVVRRGLSGLGIFASAPLKKGTFVVEYCGPMLTDEETRAKGGKYLFEVDKNKTIDGSSRKNIARYINHSCKPNCEAEIVGDRVFISTIRSIQADDELTFDYGKEYYDEYILPYGCRCASCVKKQK